MPWTFDGDYKNLAQVIPFIDDYWRLCAEFRAEGQRTMYHSLFYGRIPGLEGALALAKSGPDTGKVVESPETPIYLLAQLRYLVEGHDLIADTLAEGYRPITGQADEIVRCDSIAVFDVHLNRAVYAQARLVANDDGSLRGILPKGKQTQGRGLNGGDLVYVK